MKNDKNWDESVRRALFIPMDIQPPAPNPEDVLKAQIEELKAELKQIKQSFPPPECESCGGEMSIIFRDNREDLYSCDTCYESSGCTCFQNAPCSYCMQTIYAGDWMHEFYGEKRVEDKAKQRMVAASIKEAGPSAVASAKPVTKLVIRCQGDWSPWEENL